MSKPKLRLGLVGTGFSLGAPFTLQGDGTVVSGLTPATTYIFEYAARNSEGAGPYSGVTRASAAPRAFWWSQTLRQRRTCAFVAATRSGASSPKGGPGS